MFEELYSDPARLEQFARHAGSSLGRFQALTETFDFPRYETVCDAGGGQRHGDGDSKPHCDSDGARAPSDRELMRADVVPMQRMQRGPVEWRFCWPWGAGECGLPPHARDNPEGRSQSTD